MLQKNVRRVISILLSWDALPDSLKNSYVELYYQILCKKKFSLIVKRTFDIIVSTMMIILFLPIILIISVAIKLSSPGPVFFMQERITTYGKPFKIFKFRSMVNGADKIGSQVTIKNDSRVTGIGRIIRKFRLDEIPQLFNIFVGQMSFVGTRPEVRKYCDKYTPEMLATLLLPAGLTSLASIKFKDEEKLLASAESVDETYVNEVLPQKMKYNLEYIKNFGFFYDIKIMFKTAVAVVK